MGLGVIISNNNGLVSSDAKLDKHSDTVDTPNGRALKFVDVVELFDPFGDIEIDDKAIGMEVEFAVKEEEHTYSGKGFITYLSSVKCVIEIKELNNNLYNNIIGRAKQWQAYQENY